MTTEVLLFIGKAVWAGFTLLLGGIIKSMWSDHKQYKSETERTLSDLQQRMTHSEANMVTRVQLDEVLDRKTDPLKEQINMMRTELRSDILSLSSDIKDLLRSQTKG